MANAAVSFAIENVGNLLIQEGKFLYGVRGQVEEMQRELKWMQCFLKEAERRKGESDVVRNWVSEIREAAYDVEDVVERFVLRTALRNRKGVLNHIKKYAFFVNHGVELHQVGSRIKAIKAKLSNLRTSLQTYGIRELKVGGEGAPVRSRRKRQDYAHIVDHNVVGLNKKIIEIVQRLIDVEEASVVCIYGMGGLGKTTTAKLVYSNHRVREHFECFAWVYVSQEFDQRQVWESILSQLSDREVNSMSGDQLTSRLSHLQKEKKCLLVMDDIWQNQDWDKLSVAFSYMDTSYRSKILFTTRNESVASHGVYHTSLDVLDHNTSLMLLKNTILFLGGPNHPIKERSELDKCAGEMVKECAGLPLAITVLGGVLATKHELTEWERVGVSIRSYLNRGEQNGNNGVTKVLESSFEDLPYHLKSCFLYFSQYKEDGEIKRSELVQKWIGEGFVSASMDEAMEVTTEEYLNELVSRCMSQAGTTHAGTRGHTGRVRTCRIHDLMRDMCILKAKEEGFAHSIKLKRGIRNEGADLDKVNSRRLSVSFDLRRGELGESILSSTQDICPRLRSICFHIAHAQYIDEEYEGVELMTKKLKLVRVLDVTNTAWFYYSWKEKLGNLIHLRFLKLEVDMFPTSVGDWRCLQTLNLRFCSHFAGIPDSIWGLEQLRHLYLPPDCECESSKQRVCNFRNLQTLVNFPPGKFDLQQNLVKFTNVRKLVISQRFEEIGGISRSLEILFNELQSLSFIHRTGSERLQFEAITRASPRVYRLVIHGHIRDPTTSSFIWPSNLTKLVLSGCDLDESHMEPLAKLQSLKVLFLFRDAFDGKEMTFYRSDFPQLRHIKLKDFHYLEAWAVHEGALPSLVCLEIKNCWKLQSVPHGSEFLKQLKQLKVKDMPLTFKNRLQQGGDHWDRVSHLPSVFFSNCDMEPKEMTDDGDEVEVDIEQ